MEICKSTKKWIRRIPLIKILIFYFITTNAQLPDGVVFDSVSAYKIGEPGGWIINHYAGREMNLPCVLFLQGYNWATSPVVMYAKLSPLKNTEIDSFIALSINEFKKHDSNFYTNEYANGFIDGMKYIIMDYYGGPQMIFNRVLYVKLINSIAYISFTAWNKNDFDTFADDLLEIIETFEYCPQYINFYRK